MLKLPYNPYTKQNENRDPKEVSRKYQILFKSKKALIYIVQKQDTHLHKLDCKERHLFHKHIVQVHCLAYRYLIYPVFN